MMHRRRIWPRLLACAAALLVSLVALAAPPSESAADALRRREQTFQQVWSRVKERHYDPKLHGVDWDAVRARYAPQVARVQSDAEFYALLNRMLGELKQSHFGVVAPEGYVAEEATQGRALDGETGMIVQIVDDRPTLTRVEPDSPAARAGLRPGFLLTEVDGRPLEAMIRGIQARKLRTGQERAQIQFGIQAQLNGPAGSPVRVGYLDGDGQPQTLTLTRVQPPGERVRFGELPPVYARWEAKRLAGGIGYLRFNLFMMPVLEPIRKAIGEMRAARAPGIILDLRGNVGGIGMMAAPIAASFSAKRVSLGTMKLRQGEMNFVVYPAPAPYTGPLVILTDETSLSTSEILAGGLQEIKRAVIMGRPTAGMILPSFVERLPGGGVLQYAIADFKTPGGILLEGRGVSPDIDVPLTRRDLLLGRDPILEEAVAFIRSAPGTSAASTAARNPSRAAAVPAKPKKAAAAPRPTTALSAMQVLERYLNATGGRAAYAKMTSLVTKGTMENQAQGLRGTFAAYVKAPDKVLVVQSLAGIEAKQGFDGKIGWSQDPFSGLRTLEGPELVNVKRASQFDTTLNFRGQYKKAEVLGRRKENGRDAIVLRLTPLVGQPVVGYYDARTFLLLRTDMVVESPQGTIPMQVYFSDYRPVAGIKMPFVTRQRMGGIIEIVLRITEIQTNVPLDDALFAKPAAPAQQSPAP